MAISNQATAVENLQRYLRRLSFDDPRIPRVPVDGIFDTVTEDATRAFQDIYLVFQLMLCKILHLF